MLYKTVKLKNGQTVALSWLEESDLPEAMQAINTVIREDKYLFIDKEITDLKLEREWFRKGKESGAQDLVIRIDSKVVGGAGLTPFTGKRAHIAEFGIYIRRGYRNRGLGTIVLKEFIEIARKNGFDQIQLSAFSNNKRAIHVYAKCGFKKCGKLTRDVKFQDGTYADRILMELLLRA